MLITSSNSRFQSFCCLWRNSAERPGRLNNAASSTLCTISRSRRPSAADHLRLKSNLFIFRTRSYRRRRRPQLAATVLQLAATVLHAAATVLHFAATVLQVAATLLHLADTVLHVAATVLQFAETELQLAATVLQLAATVLQLAATVLHDAATVPACNSGRWKSKGCSRKSPIGLAGIRTPLRSRCSRKLASRHACASSGAATEAASVNCGFSINPSPQRCGRGYVRSKGVGRSTVKTVRRSPARLAASASRTWRRIAYHCGCHCRSNREGSIPACAPACSRP